MTAQIPDTKPGNYYVTVRDGDRYDFLAGPFRDDHQAALDLVDRCRESTESFDTWAHFYAFGTARIDYGYSDSCKLTRHLGLPTGKGHSTQKCRQHRPNRDLRKSLGARRPACGSRAAVG